MALSIPPLEFLQEVGSRSIQADRMRKLTLGEYFMAMLAVGISNFALSVPLALLAKSAVAYGEYRNCESRETRGKTRCQKGSNHWQSQLSLGEEWQSSTF